ncbi:sulfatase-like hydrolase/transferase [Botryobacter ruber]|uniref:sulfatase-like hydrolase/transferase n=1 Tax=Botryobacter ruber TaxID=2171629 RepID=UPI000E0B805F|nr:sulfatase-like hydrolase/transferase [Botryobacter ruber]
MRLLVRKKYFLHIFIFLLLCLYTVTVEMRPGRVYFVVQHLLFRQSLLALLQYLAVFGLTVGSVQVLLFNKSRLIRYLFLLALFPFLLVSLSYRFITGYNYWYADAQTALGNLSLAPEAISNFNLHIGLGLISCCLILLVFVVAARKSKGLYSPWLSLLLIPATLLSYWYINRSTGGTDDFPALYRVPLSTLLAAKHALPLGNRQEVTAAPLNSGARHIFMIVDESITGSALSLNGATMNTTPYLKANTNQIINFGIASSATNYSAGSNIALLSGLRLSDMPDKKRKALTAASIFQYAKQAGYTTYFIDAQLGRGMLQNYMSPQDLNYIDHFIQPSEEDPSLPYYQRDFVVADKLIQLSGSEEKVFVYVNKAGAHWPYARTYPPDSVFFRPVLAERSMLKDREKSLNTYFNAIRWTVDSFWQKLIPAISPTDRTVIIYTSDHGQDLSGDGISMAHASSQHTKPIEANVPLWLLDKSGFLGIKTQPTMHTRSHEQIFPTLLLLQGYDSTFVKTRFGNSLLDEVPNSRRYFYTGDIFGRGTSTKVPFKVTGF